MSNATASYDRDGFHIHEAAAIPVDTLLAAQAGMWDVRDGSFDTGRPPSSHPGYDPAKLCKINDAHLASTELYDLVCHSALGSLAAQVTGAKAVQLWASQLLIKPPASGAQGNVGWHQDRQYWSYWQDAEGLFTMWIALSDVGEQSGAMRFVRGSQGWGFLGEGDFFGKDHAAQREQISIPEGQVWEEVPAILQAGGVSLHHCLSYHGSGPNTSAEARCSIALHLRTEKARRVVGDSNYHVSHLEDEVYSPIMHGSSTDFVLQAERQGSDKR